MDAKLKILGIVPYAGMNTVMTGLADQYPQLQMDVYVANMESAARIAREHFYADGYDIIVSRGGTANLLKQDGFPVIEIEISLYDILCALRLADGIDGKIAMVVYANIAVNAKTLCDLIGYQIEIISVKNLTDLEPTLRALRAQNYHTVLCDTVANSIARKLGLNAILVTAGVESIQHALNWAQVLCGSRRQLQTESRFYQEVLRSQPGQTIVLDEEGGLIFHSADFVPEELLTELRQEQRTGGSASRRVARSINRTTQFIRIQKTTVNDSTYTVFCIEPRKISACPGQLGMQFLSHHEVETSLYESIFGFAGIMNEYRTEIDRLCAATAPVLIAGEDGTGKDETVNALYLNGPYHVSPLVVINCSVLNDKTWAFLMGHHNSPLTDTKTTIYFSNVDALSASRRNELIEILVELKVSRHNFLLFSCGCPASGQITMESAKLLNSLCCLALYLSPLRTLEKNISTLVNLTLSHLNVDQPYPVLGATPDAIRMLQEFSWPQNYTQFFRVVKELSSTSTNQAITAGDVQRVLSKERYSGSFAPHADNAAAPLDLNRTLSEINRDIAIRVLHETGDNQTAAAKHLGISRTTLWRLLRSSELEPDEKIRSVKSTV